MRFMVFHIGDRVRAKYRSNCYGVITEINDEHNTYRVKWDDDMDWWHHFRDIERVIPWATNYARRTPRRMRI